MYMQNSTGWVREIFIIISRHPHVKFLPRMGRIFQARPASLTRRRALATLRRGCREGFRESLGSPFRADPILTLRGTGILPVAENTGKMPVPHPIHHSEQLIKLGKPPRRG